MNHAATQTEALESRTDVLIVGAGPTGLTLAIELARRGIDYRLVEQNDTTVTTSRALGINPRTLQAFEDMGLLDGILSDGFRLTGQRVYRGEEQLVRLSTDSVRNDTDYPYLWVLPQYRTEQALLDRLTELGGTVDFECELTGFRQNADSVTARLSHKNGEAGLEVLTASWLVGCDGGSSTVRKELDFDFSGETRPETFLLADVTVESDWPRREALTWFHADGIIAVLPLNGEEDWRIFAEISSVPEAERPDATATELQTLLAERMGTDDATIREVTWSSEYTVNQRMVDRYRSDNVFLAGDAAHVHSPFGAMGMNTGVQDAYNLGWKLALVTKGQAGTDLLATYEEERRPVAEGILDRTGPSTGLISSTNPVVDVLREHVLGPILERERVQARVLSATTQLGIDYRRSSLSRTSSASPVDDLLDRSGLRGMIGRAWRAPKAGDRLLDGPCLSPSGSESSLYEQIHGRSGFTLLVFAGVDGTGQELGVSLARDLADRLGDDIGSYLVVPDGAEAVGAQPDIETLVDPETRLHERYGAVAPVAYLVRPDDYIGFRGALSAGPQLRTYLREQVGFRTDNTLRPSAPD